MMYDSVGKCLSECGIVIVRSMITGQNVHILLLKGGKLLSKSILFLYKVILPMYRLSMSNFKVPIIFMR